MNRVSRKFRHFISLYYMMKYVSWIQLIRYHKKQSKNIVWILPCGRNNLFPYFKAGYLMRDFSLISAFIKSKRDFRVIIGQKIERVKGKDIYYTISRMMDIHKRDDYFTAAYQRINGIELLGNRVYPSSGELRLWENKSYMHKVFSDLKISHPATFILEKKNCLPIDLQFPVLIKEIHSAGSAGIYKVNDQEEFKVKIDGLYKRGEKEILVQRLIDMHRDLRVILIGNEIVLYYWRINNASEWRPTSTIHESFVDFDYFPERWRDYIVEAFNKLNISTGAFDITWEKDDINTKPLFLEVSPVYQPNPKLPEKYKHLPYGTWKKKYFIGDSYLKLYVKLSYELKYKLIQYWLSQESYK